MSLLVLFENASGYALFEQVKGDEVNINLEEVQQSIQDLAKFSTFVKLKAFLPFTSAENALENINAISEGELTPYLANFLELNLPKSSKSGKVKATLGVSDPKIGNAISEQLGVKCKTGELVAELARGIRLHFPRFIKALKPGDIAQAQLGLGHSYSRAKVKFNVHRVDNMVVQAISLLDNLDKDLNTFAMRVREWYGWHFPELVGLVNDNAKYCQLARLIQDKATLSDEKLPQLEEIVEDPSIAKAIVEAAKISMGSDLAPIDMVNVEQFAGRVHELCKYRVKLYKYLVGKMNACAPNLTALIGEQVGARLISHAGSLTNLAKYPASTVQILGAEKALFRALKTRGNTPKYGLIFHSTFIGRAKPQNKGRISRYLANKCSLASRIDCFSDWGVSGSTDAYGKKLREQVEERLEFYKSGKQPRKNVEVMAEVVEEERKRREEAENGAAAGEDGGEKKKKQKKRKAEPEAAAPVQPVAVPADEVAEKKKKKKSKKPE